jgi:hypothetical protein
MISESGGSARIDWKASAWVRVLLMSAKHRCINRSSPLGFAQWYRRTFLAEDRDEEPK